MRQKLPKLLSLAGGATLVIGIAFTVTLVVLRGRCSSDALGSQGNVTLASASCQSSTPAIHWSYLLLGLGAVLFVAAALSGTNVVQKRPDGDRRVSATLSPAPFRRTRWEWTNGPSSTPRT